MTQEMQEAVEVVGLMQDWLYEHLSEQFNDGSIFIELKTDGFEITIEFCGYEIWNTQDEQREYDEELDCYIPNLETHLKMRINDYISALNKLKF